MNTLSQQPEALRGSGTGVTRVLVADAFEPAGLAALKELGCDTVHEPERCNLKCWWCARRP